MVSPAQRRGWVAWVREAFRITTRRACRATGVARSLVTYRSQKAAQAPLRQRLKELAMERVSYGYRRLHTLLRREGWGVNAKRAYRLYRLDELQLRRKRPRRRRSAVVRGPRAQPARPHEVWGMDFMHDTLMDGRLLRVLTLIDSYTRECVALVAGARFRGEDRGNGLKATDRVKFLKSLARRLRGRLVSIDREAVQRVKFTSLIGSTLQRWPLAHLDPKHVLDAWEHVAHLARRKGRPRTAL